MSDRRVAIRLGTEGKATIVTDLNEIGVTGDAAFNRVARSAVKAGKDAADALAFAERQAAKLAAITPGINPSKIDVAVGVRTDVGKSAQASAAVFSAAYAQMEQRAEALRMAVDPAYAAQHRFDVEIAEARTLIAAGAISLDDYSRRVVQLQAGLAGARAGQVAVAQSGNGMRTAMAGASYQVQDFVTQLSMGANPVQAFVVQGGQLAGQFMNVEGKAGAVARFMMGGWGLALQIGLMALAPFIAKLWEGSDAEKKIASASEEHRKAVLALADAQGKAIQTAERKQAVDVATIKIELDAAMATRERAQAELTRAQAIARLAAALASTGSGSADEAIAKDGDLARATARIAELNKSIADNDREIARLQKGFDTGYARMAQGRAQAGSTPEGRINQRYDKQIADAMTDLAGVANGPRLRAKLDELYAARDRELKAIEKSATAREQFGREVTSSQASAIARAAGFQVNSADRSTARQQQLYDAWVAAGRPADNPVAKPGTSAHERGNALDIQFEAGVTAKKIKDAFAAEGVRLTKVFAERGHWHVEWQRTAEQRAIDSDAAKAVRDLATANRELDSDLADVVKQFDPARAAADDYAKALAKIARLQAAGRLSAADGLKYSLDAAIAEDKRQTELAATRFRTIMGDSGYDEIVRSAEQATKDRQQILLGDIDKRTERERQGIQELGNFYRQVMTGGVSSIWEGFKQRGIEVIADLAAKWTMSQLSSASGGLLGKLGALFGGRPDYSMSAVSNDTMAALSKVTIPKFAAGTEYSSGGAALVGEEGPEIVSLPRGSRVTTAGDTRRMLSGANDNSGPTTIIINANDAVLASTVRDWVAQGMDIAATRGAAGGAGMAASMQIKRARRRIVR